MANPLLLTLVCLFAYFQIIQSLHPFRTVYEWEEIDFQFDKIEDRTLAIKNGVFIPKNNIPFGLEVHKNRAFLTLPRFKDGVVASLAYFDLTNDTERPILKPYPSWEAHNTLNKTDVEILSPYRVRADQCDRLWVLDTRILHIFPDRPLNTPPTQLLVYDLHNDTLLRRYVFPEDHMKQHSYFTSLAIDDSDCEQTYAYAGDQGDPGLVVYSWEAQDSWKVKHNYFYPDPLGGDFDIHDIAFHWTEGLYGLALNKARTPVMLYFHPLSSNMEFMVDTTLLQNKTKATSGDIYHDFKIVGSRGVKAQAGASVIDKNTETIFYALPNMNAVGYWQIKNKAYELKPENTLTDPVDFYYPNDVRVDADNQLWVLSNRLSEYIYGVLNENAPNYRILMAPITAIVQENTYDSGANSTYNNMLYLILFSVLLPLIKFIC